MSQLSGPPSGQGEQPDDVVEGEPEVLGVSDEPHHPDRVVGVLAVPGPQPGGWGDQAAAFVEPQRFHADPGGRRDRSDTHHPSLPPGGLTL